MRNTSVAVRCVVLAMKTLGGVRNITHGDNFLYRKSMGYNITMSKEQWIKIGKGALIAIAGAFVVYIPEVVTEVDWGVWTPFAVATASILVNILRVYTQK